MECRLKRVVEWLCVYQSVQPVMDVCLKLWVIQDSTCEAKQDTDGLFQRLERTRLGFAARTI